MNSADDDDTGPQRRIPLSRAALIAAAGGAALLLYAFAPSSAENAVEGGSAKTSGREAPLVETVISRAEPYQRFLRLRGRSEAARKVEISAQTAGLVVSPPRLKGERIAKGEPLCEIEQADREARLAEAKARLVEAEAVAKASAELSKKGFSAETTFARDQAALQAAKTAVAAIELDIRRTRMTAPFDGWLETDTAELGALLSVGDPCATLLALDPIRFVGFAAETDVGALRLGLPARAKLVDGRTVDAKVSFIARAADERTRTFRVEATAPNPENATQSGSSGVVREGATATIFIALGEQPAHRAPRSALMLNDEGRLGVMLAEDGRARFQPTEILSDGADGVWFTGPPERAEIVVTGQYVLSDGSPLKTALRNENPRDPPPKPQQGAQ